MFEFGVKTNIYDKNIDQFIKLIRKYLYSIQQYVHFELRVVSDIINILQGL